MNSEKIPPIKSGEGGLFSNKYLVRWHLAIHANAILQRVVSAVPPDKGRIA